MKTPINGARLSSSFGMRKHPILGYNKMHRGTDFAGNQFLYTIKDFERNNLENSKLRKFKIPVGKAQIEAIKIIDESSFWITSEDEGNGFPRLFNFKIN